MIIIMIVIIIVIRTVSTKVILIVHDKSNNVSNNVGGCQHYGPFLDPYYNTAPNI